MPYELRRGDLVIVLDSFPELLRAAALALGQPAARGGGPIEGEAIKSIGDLLDTAGGTVDEVGALPDGSGFATASFPLRDDHWLYADNSRPPMPFRTSVQHPLRGHISAMVTEAARYAVRGATMSGQVMDFDPDALVQNMIVGMLGYCTPSALTEISEEDARLFNPVPVPRMFQWDARSSACIEEWCSRKKLEEHSGEDGPGSGTAVDRTPVRDGDGDGSLLGYVVPVLYPSTSLMGPRQVTRYDVTWPDGGKKGLHQLWLTADAAVEHLRERSRPEAAKIDASHISTSPFSDRQVEFLKRLVGDAITDHDRESRHATGLEGGPPALTARQVELVRDVAREVVEARLASSNELREQVDPKAVAKTAARNIDRVLRNEDSGELGRAD